MRSRFAGSAVVGAAVLVLALGGAGVPPAPWHRDAGGQPGAESDPDGGASATAVSPAEAWSGAQRSGHASAGQGRVIRVKPTRAPASGRPDERADAEVEPHTPLTPIAPGAPTTGRRTARDASQTQVAQLAAADLAVSTAAPTAHPGSLVPEPSVGTNGPTSLITWNWSAAVTANGGSSFSYLNPLSQQNAYGGFCCDQSAYYDPSRDLYFWIVQFVADAAGNNAIRLLVAKGAARLESGQFASWDLTPQQIGAAGGVWYDQPKVARSSNDLYLEITSYSGSSFVGSVVLRFGLDDLAAGNLDYDYFRPTVGTPGFTEGATDTMYFAGHVNTGTLRVYRWPEAVGPEGITSTDVAHDTYPRNVPYSCPRTGGAATSDWCQRLDSGHFAHDDRVMGGWIANGIIGFGWDASQGQAGSQTFPFPHLRFVRIAAATGKLIDQPILWSDKYAFSYAAVAPNRYGDLGGTVIYGGGTTYENCGILVHDGYVSGSDFWEVDPAETSDADPQQPIGGDYLAARSDPANPDHWAATCYALHGGGADDDMHPYALSFGRQSPAVPLAVSRDGSGTGSVASSPARISCGDLCTDTFPQGASVTLTATAAGDSAFTGWTGDCSGAGPTCTLTMDGPHAAGATFVKLEPLTVTTAGSGTGQVTSSPAGIDCGSTCSLGFLPGTNVTLTAAPADGSVFTGWTGDCAGTEACTLTMGGAHSVQATFARVQALTVAKRGLGSGEVRSNPAGIDCGQSCSAKFANGATVTLTAVPGTRSQFVGWSAPCTGRGACVLSVTGDFAVTAKFQPLCIVPRLVGLKLGRAEHGIEAAHCSIGRTSRHRSGRRAGTVVSQRPAPGTRASYRAHVDLVVSSGRG